MRRVWLSSFALVAFLAVGDYNAARAVPVDPYPLNAASSASGTHLARAVVRGPRGGGAVVGRRYHGGVWYGTGRRYWRGRWWAYGVGSCWRSTPIGYVWICG